METVQTNNTTIKNIGKILIDESRPLKERFRALFTLRNIGGELSVRCIENCFSDPSVLLKHECAYCLGQMQDPHAVPKLKSILENVNEDPIVRHEAAEALAAIGEKSCLETLQRYTADPSIEVSQTCELAVRKLQDDDSRDTQSQNPYKSVDPATPFPRNACKSVEELESILLDESQPLYTRYRAMFSLRNLDTDVAAATLAKGLVCGSALFRHEVAYVLGQMQNASTVEQLSRVLFDESEHEMVRHECAEALGSIATEECMRVLGRYLGDERRVVRESCEVALDMCDYENGAEFQYADALLKAASYGVIF